MATVTPTAAELAQDRGPVVVGAVVALIIIATSAVALRLFTRINGRVPLMWDDLLICIALLFAWGTCAGCLIAVHYGLGKHIYNPEIHLNKIIQTLWAYEFLYGTVTPLIKLSIILFYHRVFPIKPFTYALYFCTFLVIGWWISIIVVAGAQCKPYSYFWLQYTDPSVKGKCVNIYDFFIGNAVASVITDFIILMCPVPMIWSLKMPLVQRMAVIGIFALGGFVCVAGIVRTYTQTYMNLPDGDLTWNMCQAFIWSCVEPCIGILCACLPVLRPLLRRAFPSWFNRSSGNDRSSPNPSAALSGLKHSGGTVGGSHSHTRSDGFGRLDGRDRGALGRLRPSDDEVALTNEIDAGSMSGRERGYPMNAINVKRDVEWSASAVSDGDSK